MKILAAFEGTTAGEQTLAILSDLAKIPDAEVVLLAMEHVPTMDYRFQGDRRMLTSGEIFRSLPGAPAATVRQVETKDQAIERSLSELDDFLETTAHKLPAGTRVHVEAHVAPDPGDAIVDRAQAEHPDMIVMACRRHHGVGERLLGCVAEHVLRSGVAPTLIVHEG